MKALVIREKQEPYVDEIGQTLSELQHLVDGRIEVIYLDAGTVLVCNEEGKILGLPANRPILDKNGIPVDYIAGTFLICGTSWESDDFKDLNKAQIRRYSRMFAL